MTLRHFRIFVAVCDTMNMTSAAEGLYMSQSAVSQAIAEMERHYGTRLFERLSRRLYLTQAGEKLLSYARHMIRMNSEVENDMKTLRKSGRIRVGASVTVGACILPRLLAAFQNANPDVEVTVVEDNTARMEDMILDDRIDLALVEGEISSPDLIDRPLMEDSLVLVCAPDHRFASLTQVEPGELEQEKFVIREPGSGTRKTFEDSMASARLNWKTAWICNNVDTIKTVVELGLGISVMSRLAVRDEIASGRLVAKSVRGVGFQRFFRLIYHKNKFLTPSMTRLIEHMILFEQGRQPFPYRGAAIPADIGLPQKKN